MGIIESGWHREKDGKIQIRVTVPFNAEAHVVLPWADAGTLTAGDGGRFHWIQNNENAETYIEAGSYVFEYLLTKDFNNTYNVNDLLGDLKKMKRQARLFMK